MLGWAALCNNLLPYLWLFPLARSLDGESLKQRAWASLRFFEHSAKLLPWGLLSFGSTWWKMSLVAEDRQGQAREKEHSKHSSRKRHSGVTEAAALWSRSPVICGPAMKAWLVALPFLESRLWILPYKDSRAPDTLAFSAVPRAQQAHSHPRAFAFAVLLSWECFSLRTCPDGGFLIIYVSVHKLDAQRGHLWWPPLKKQISSVSGSVCQVDFTHNTS